MNDTQQVIGNIEAPELRPQEISNASQQASVVQENNSPELGKKPAKKKPVKPIIDSMESFLLVLLKNHRFSTNEQIFRVLKGNASLALDARDRFLGDAIIVDPGLELGRRLMLAALQAYCYPRVTETLRDIARDLVMQHPAIKNMSANELFPAEGDVTAPRMLQISRKLGQLRQEAEHQRKIRAKKKTDQKTPADMQIEDPHKDDSKALGNAIFAAAFWRVSLRLAGIEEILGCLHQELFSCKSDERQVGIDLLSFLSNCQDLNGVSALMGWYAERVKQEGASTAFLVSQGAKKEAELGKVTAERDAAQTKIKELEGLITNLDAALVEEKEQRTTECLHLRGNQEKQRVHTLRTLDSDIQLISESLVALTRVPPKVAVVHNYLTRVFESLGSEISYLKEL